jgi:NADPH-dependent glutamate synthase beta subunit-like oxidoreductase
LSAAYQLALKGHAVTLFDERAELGGMMRYGIPGFRTPRDVLDAEIQRILDLGMTTRMNCRIGTDITMSQRFALSLMPYSWDWARKLAVLCQSKVPTHPTA